MKQKTGGNRNKFDAYFKSNPKRERETNIPMYSLVHGIDLTHRRQLKIDTANISKRFPNTQNAPLEGDSYIVPGKASG